MEKLKFFRYSGSKTKYIDLINNEIRNNKVKDIYVEPFVGSGSILFNLEKDFKQYIVCDIDRNITLMYFVFKLIDYKLYKKEIDFIRYKFGNLKTNKTIGLLTEEVKKNYYNFREWFNKNYYKSNTIKEGIYLHILTNSCINSFLRFGPNGMNQSFGNREFRLSEENFKKINKILKKTIILNKDYKEVFKIYKNKAFYFLDPPYFSQKSSYSGFTKVEFLEFLDQIKDKNYIYTDILNDCNKDFKNKKFIREMSSTSPSSNKAKNGNMEYLFYNYNN